MENKDHLEKLNKLVDMKFSFKGQLNDQYIVDIVSEKKYLVGGYGIIYPDTK